MASLDCSRICCTEAIKNALHLKDRDPDAEVYILYRDIRTYGFKERLYTQARAAGVIFVRYDDEHRPQVTADGDLTIRAWDPSLRRDLLLAWRGRADVLVTLAFFIIVVCLFPFGVGAEPNLLRAIAPGVLWVAALLAVLLASGRMFQDDLRSGWVDQWVLTCAATGTPLALLVAARLAAQWLLAALPVLAVVTDDIRVNRVNLFYRVAGTATFVQAPMADTYRFAFTATIPAGSITPAGMEYYITASDTMGNVTSVGSAASPLFVVVQPRTIGGN